MMIDWVYGPEPRSSGGNTSSNPQISALIARPVSNGMEGYVNAMGVITLASPVLVQKPLRNQFI